MSYIKFFGEISKSDTAEVGGKGASLGEMTKAGLSVPPGFVITSEAYRKFGSSNIPADFKKEILSAFDRLGVERVAVRSSAVAEDSKTASWAGQLESYLNTTREKLIENVEKCWESITSERAKSYAADQNVPKDQLVVAVVVQKMVDSESSGVMFSVNPITHNINEIMIEAGLGLGEMIVQGMITPSNYKVNKNSLAIKNKDIQPQESMLVFQSGRNKKVSVPTDKKGKSPLTDPQIKWLAQLAIKIEDHYKTPQDIEWAYADGEPYILQSRPITTL